MWIAEVDRSTTLASGDLASRDAALDFRGVTQVELPRSYAR